MKDELSDLILEVINKAKSPLETKEIYGKLNGKGSSVSRSKIIYRLSNLRGEGEIEGKQVGSGKGVWIWWRKNGLGYQPNPKRHEIP